MTKAPEIIEKLVEHFERDFCNFKNPAYNETELRADFVNPFWKALGWDMTNESGYAMPYRDVKQEYPLKTGLTTEAPDYCFTIAGKPKFFLETKKPSVDVKNAIHPAYQLRRYGWSGKLPLSILTDFEEMAVYDCRIRPEKNDKPSQARIKLWTYTDYIDLWDEIAGIFSREAILKGSFDKFADSTKGKRGTSEVDSEFLKEIEIWREKLAKNIALRNSGITVRELNFAVQATIDRIIFLRMAEDRGIEEYAQLQSLCSRADIYKYLLEIFYNADKKYNSGLFHFSSEKDRPEYDTLTPRLKIDDKALKEILSRLYYPESPYEFSFMPTEILGNVYEQFLGKVIHLTKGHQAKIEEKPEVKKAGGVYYTPEYIVEYIVANTVGKLCENKTPKEISDLRILDPACGSGSFLIGAYRFLLDYHLKWYLADMEQKKKVPTQPETSKSGKKTKSQQAIYQGQDGEWYMSTSEKKRILLNNIFGVDIDSQAVEVTKLSLLLKVLENENKATLLKQIELFKERALPDLSGNIKCGNSLIGSDFYDSGGQTMLFDPEERYRINAFDWEDEFSEIFKRKNKGFDAVIGNPPYGYLFQKIEIQYISKILNVFRTINDAYVGFIEKAHSLLSDNGRFGFIVPSAWLGGPSYSKLRLYFLEFQIESIILLPFDVFKGAYIDTAIITTTKSKPRTQWQTVVYEYPKRERIQSIELGKLSSDKIKQNEWESTDDNKFILQPGILYLLNNIRNKYKVKFSDNILIKRGALVSSVNLEEKRITENHYHYFEGDVYRYATNYHSDHWVEFGPELKEAPKDFTWFEGERIMLRRLVNRQQRLMASVLNQTCITNKNLYSIKTNSDESLQYILGLLNSALLSRIYLSQVSQATKDDFPQVTIRDILSLPFRKIDFDNPTDKARHDRMVQLVETMLDLHKRLPNANAPHDKETLQRQIDTTDRQIDKLVYELYGLTEEEIKIVEGA